MFDFLCPCGWQALWKTGAEIMLNHPSSDILQFGSFAERMKSQNTEMRLKVGVPLKMRD